MNSFGIIANDADAGIYQRFIAHILDSLMDCNGAEDIPMSQAEALVNSLVEDDKLWQPVDDYLNNKLLEELELKGDEDNG